MCLSFCSQVTVQTWGGAIRLNRIGVLKVLLATHFEENKMHQIFYGSGLWFYKFLYSLDLMIGLWAWMAQNLNCSLQKKFSHAVVFGFLRDFSNSWPRLVPPVLPSSSILFRSIFIAYDPPRFFSTCVYSMQALCTSFSQAWQFTISLFRPLSPNGSLGCLCGMAIKGQSTEPVILQWLGLVHGPGS